MAVVLDRSTVCGVRRRRLQARLNGLTGFKQLGQAPLMRHARTRDAELVGDLDELRVATVGTVSLVPETVAALHTGV